MLLNCNLEEDPSVDDCILQKNHYERRVSLENISDSSDDDIRDISGDCYHEDMPITEEAVVEDFKKMCDEILRGPVQNSHFEEAPTGDNN
ncbi:unnamed protein product, partial [Larinioides sclopetarius]